MTPLARYLVNELTLPRKRRRFPDVYEILPKLDDIHCFECTDVIDLADDLGSQIADFGVDTSRAFLPAPKTWIEFDEGGVKTGLLLIQSGDHASVRCIMRSHDAPGSEIWFGRIGLKSCAFDSPKCVFYRPPDVNAEPPLFDEAAWESQRDSILGLLAIINTPRIIGRRQHMPHRGLERDLTRKFKLIGKFPLHAWTEIRLEVSVPRDISGEASTEAHLTGQRALHFCRAHIRIRLGRLEIVKAHWRGDASLGIKQSRYRLALPASSSALDKDRGAGTLFAEVDHG
jgi:hypothetical protein